MKKIVFFFPPKGPRNTLYDPRRRRGPLSRRGDNTSDFYTYRFGRAHTQQQQHHRYNSISLRRRSPETCTRYLVHGRGGGSGVAFQSGPSYRHAIPILNVSRSSRSYTYMSFDESFSLTTIIDTITSGARKSIYRSREIWTRTSSVPPESAVVCLSRMPGTRVFSANDMLCTACAVVPKSTLSSSGEQVPLGASVTVVYDSWKRYNMNLSCTISSGQWNSMKNVDVISAVNLFRTILGLYLRSKS